MPWSIHPENAQPNGVAPGGHIILELPPLHTFESKEEARQKLCEFAEAGRTDVYLIGYDRP